MPMPTSLLTPAPLSLDLRLVSGKWPAALNGEVVISSPSPTAGIDNGLFGFGAMTRLALRPGTNGARADRWAWRTTVIDTPARRLSGARSQPFLVHPDRCERRRSRVPESGPAAPLPWGDRIFAAWDVGRPVEIDARDSFIAEVGSASLWGPQSIPMPGLMPFYFSTAHPVIDPRTELHVDREAHASAEPDADGSMTMDVSLVRYWGRGKTVEVWPIDGAKVRGSSHTVTKPATGSSSPTRATSKQISARSWAASGPSPSTIPPRCT